MEADEPFVFDTLLEALDGPPLAHERPVWERDDAEASAAPAAEAAAATPPSELCNIYTFLALRDRFFAVPTVRAQVATGRSVPHASQCVLVSKRFAVDFVVPPDRGSGSSDAGDPSGALELSVGDLYGAALDDTALPFAARARAGEAALRARLATGTWSLDTTASAEAEAEAEEQAAAAGAPAEGEDAPVGHAPDPAAGAASPLDLALARAMTMRLMTLPQDAGECMGGEKTLENKALLANLDTQRCVFQALDVELLDNSRLATPTTLFCTLQPAMSALVAAAESGAESAAAARAGVVDATTPLGAGVACARAGERQDRALLAAAAGGVRPCYQTGFQQVALFANMTPARLLHGCVTGAGAPRADDACTPAAPAPTAGKGAAANATAVAAAADGLIVPETLALGFFLRANAGALGLELRGLRSPEDERLERAERERREAAELRKRRQAAEAAGADAAQLEALERQGLSAEERAAAAKASARRVASAHFVHVGRPLAERAAELLARSQSLPLSDPLALRLAVRPGIGSDAAGSQAADGAAPPAPAPAPAPVLYAPEDVGKTVRAVVRVWYTLVPREAALGPHVVWNAPDGGRPERRPTSAEH